MICPSWTTALRRGSVAESVGYPRSHLADGTTVWIDSRQATGAHVLDAELADQDIPPSLARMYGAPDFWVRWTRVECAVKLSDATIGAWLRRHGLTVPTWFPGAIATAHVVHLGTPLVVSVAAPADQVGATGELLERSLPRL